jgi:HNH endonuclease/CENP-B N-terminal DNA-binding domain
MAKHKVRKRTSFADPKDYIREQVTVTERGCWEWQGVPRGDGYPCTSIGGRSVSLVRYSYELFRGPVPERLHVLHTCDNPPCLNPEHLFLGTHRENMEDMVHKGRHGGCKLSPEQVEEIIQKVAQGATRPALAREYGVALSTIRNVLKGKTWGWLEGTEPPGALPHPQILTAEDVAEIRGLLGRMPYTQIALKFGVSRRCIYDIRMGKTWADLPEKNSKK